MGANANESQYRYHDSPVGAYDEVLIVPGSFAVGAKGKERDMLRVTRIYVSERGTLWNGMSFSLFTASIKTRSDSSSYLSSSLLQLSRLYMLNLNFSLSLSSIDLYPNHSP